MKTLFGNKKNRRLIALFAVVVIALYIVGGSGLPSMMVLSVDRIDLVQRGVAGADGELMGGYWRVLATTSRNTEVQFLSLTDDTMSSAPGDWPEDVNVNGEIYMEVSQEDKPYYRVPIVKLGDYTVAPATSAVMLSGSTASQINDAVSAPVTVSVWTLNMEQRQVFIPFRVIVAKTMGENTGYFTTSDVKAELINTGSYPQYRITVSQSQISTGQQSAVVTFTNPKDSAETVKVTLVWSFVDSDMALVDNLLFVTASNAGPIEAYNTFMAYDQNAIIQQLNWQSGSDWTFYRYWFGGGNIFKGTYQNAAGGAVTGIIPSWGDGSAKPVGGAPVAGGYMGAALLSEGYISGTSTINGVYEYAGWYAPFASADGPYGEGASTSDNPQWKRFPVQPQIYAGANSKPVGLSVLGYLAGRSVAPVTGQVHTAFNRVNPDLWGQGKAGECGVNGYYSVYLPAASRSWLFTADISTEACDTVVVQESYANVEITGFSVDKNIIQVGGSASATVSLKNTGSYKGIAGVGIVAPNNLAMVTSISGGDGNFVFEAGESKTVVFSITNMGTTDVDTTGTFTVKVWNGEGDLTDSRDFVLTVKAGLLVPDTQVPVLCVDADSGVPVGGITVKAEFDGSSISGSTGSGGRCMLTLGKFEGLTKITVYDVAGVHLSQSQMVMLQNGVNAEVTFRLESGDDEGEAGFDLSLLLAGAVVALLVGLVYTQRRFITGRRR